MCGMSEEKKFEKIAKKVEEENPLSRDEGLMLLHCEDIFFLGGLANIIREKKNGNHTHYNINAHINPSNVCINECLFCSFFRKPGDSEAYDLSIEEILVNAAKIITPRTTELHIVGGVHPSKDLRFYGGLLAALKERYPFIQLKAFTATEIDQMAKLSGVSIEEALKELKASGLVSLPGGGAEIFSPRVRMKVCPKKISGERWLEIHRIAHSLGIKTNATMLYGHIETNEERVDHLFRLRELQKETNGFQAFIPLPFHPQNNPLGGSETTGCLDIKIHAVSRIILDNIDHIKAYWVMTGVEMAQVLQNFGVDDLDGTVTEEKITHAAGAKTPSHLDEDFIHYLISSAGRVPVERDTLYNRRGSIKT